MKKVQNLVTGVVVLSLTSVPAFAGGLTDLLSSILCHTPTPPCGAPAPMLAAGIPAFLALGGAVLASKIFPQLRGPAE